MDFFYMFRHSLIGHDGTWVGNEEVVEVPTYLNKSVSLNIAINL